jgi:hypothetical protein
MRLKTHTPLDVCSRLWHTGGTWRAQTGDAHRKNILTCGRQESGVGYSYLADDPGNVTAHTYWTQDFGTRVGA